MGERIPSTSSLTNAERLARFVGPMIERDQEVVDFWRAASPAEHAKAMIELSDYATSMIKITGIGKDPNERFPGFPPISKSA
ncbi:MAG: hypothetical protein JWO41_456 [Candidatus Saccharibacteria bacterium]|nr:hypothetical protein [Candidatus Saccharibacteria bacterium]